MNREFLIHGIGKGNITRAILGDALSLPFRSGAFSTVLAMGIIDHIPTPRIPYFLDQLVRVTDDRGSVLIQVTSPFSLNSAIARRSFWDRLHPFSPFRLIKEMERMGMKPVEIQSSGLVGSFDTLPVTVRTFVPWALHITVVFSRPN